MLMMSLTYKSRARLSPVQSLAREVHIFIQKLGEDLTHRSWNAVRGHADHVEPTSRGVESTQAGIDALGQAGAEFSVALGVAATT